jgi:transcriptional regulator with XRE-family HTH domain
MLAADMTVGDFIDALGGNAAVAQMAGVGRSAVSNWRKFDRFPPRLYLRFAAAARERGLEAPERLFEERRAEASAA